MSLKFRNPKFNILCKRTFFLTQNFSSLKFRGRWGYFGTNKSGGRITINCCNFLRSKNYANKMASTSSALYHTQKKRKDSLVIRPYCRYFRLNLKYLGWSYKEYIKTRKNSAFCEGLVDENDFEVVLAIFCCYNYGANASGKVQKSATD